MSPNNRQQQKQELNYNNNNKNTCGAVSQNKQQPKHLWRSVTGQEGLRAQIHSPWLAHAEPGDGFLTQGLANFSYGGAEDDNGNIHRKNEDDVKVQIMGRGANSLRWRALVALLSR